MYITPPPPPCAPQRIPAAQLFTTFTLAHTCTCTSFKAVNPLIGDKPLGHPNKDIIIIIIIIINRVPPGDIERAILALPCRDGGLGIVNPSSLASQFQDSMHITKSLVQKILQQDQSAEGVPAATITAKAEIVSQSRRLAKEAVASVIATSTSTTERTLNLAAEKGASSWLTCRPLRQYGFNLHKQAFWDALCLRYGWTPPGLPTECVCGKAFSPEHALSCPTGGYPAMRHNDLRDLTASLLREVAHDVQVEPHLQPLTGETFRHRSAISEDGARLDVAASGV